MQFTDKGGDKFHDVTRLLAQRGRQVQTRNNIDDEAAFQQFAIVLDNVIKSAPTIDFNQNPDGIPPGNGAQITGIGSLSEAKDLALVLQTGALPVKFVIAERTDVSATLGKDSLKQAKTAAIAGLLARRDLPAPPLSLPRPGRRARPRASTRPSCTRRSCSSTSR